MRILLMLATILTRLTVNGASEINHGEALVAWLKEQNGFFHPNLQIRRFEGSDSSYGMFATKNIPAKDTLMVIPRSILITSGGTGDVCDATKNLIKEMKLKDESKYAPYVNYLLDQPHGQLPSAWSDAGKELLVKIVGSELPAAEDMTSMFFAEDCGANFDDQFENNAYMMVLQRGWDDVLIPVFDMMSHGNGKWLNTDHDSLHTDKDVVVRASRDIEAGEQIYTTYDLCTDCGARYNFYGTPQLLRDYGFVEQYPQRWIFEYPDFGGQRIAFRLDEKEPHDITSDEKSELDLQLSWLPNANGHKLEFCVRFLMAHLKRIEQVVETELPSAERKVPKNELDVIMQFHQALKTAMALAIDAAQAEAHDDDSPEEVCTVSHDGNLVCSLPFREYDRLEKQTNSLDFDTAQCAEGRFVEFSEYETIDETITQYQEIEFYQHPSSKDTCLGLDGTVQICGSYRPHYHELVVHFTARYISEIKRVLWVGGGDSMLLHEILKYPSLELAIGLEIDQQVTRGSFKHFGTQPHWDNEKVQWWYGDASKSLLVLPKEYFGSFDMVLVDLSETVTSNLVTEGLDIMGALGLLLQPEGILVKNELYLEKMSSIFDYTVQVSADGVPVVCAQTQSMGSPGLDFLSRIPKDHGVGGLFINPPSEVNQRFEFWRDYRQNKTSTFRQRCISAGETEKEPSEQTSSPGILMILEAEDLSFPLKPTENVEKLIKKTLKKESLKVVSSHLRSSDEKGEVVVILREGYVVARTWPDHKYCGFDILLWSSFDKHDKIKKALLAAVGGSGGKASSSYRIVTGGMFGLSTWKEDFKKQGPLFQPCREKEVRPRKTPMDRSAVDSVLSESIALIQDSDPVVAAVFCRDKSQPCQSLDVLGKHDKIRETVAIWTCPGVGDGDNSKMFACETDIWKTLSQAATGERKLGAIVLDPSAPFPMAQIVLKIFSSHVKKKQLLSPNVLVVASMLDETEAWRRHFADRFRTDVIVYEPVFTSEALFNSTDSSMSICVTSSGDASYFRHLLDVVARIEKKTVLVSDVRNVENGLWPYLPEFKPQLFALPKDYDQSFPLEQWKSQHPIGFQSVFQFEVQEYAKGDRVMGNFEGAGQWFPGRVGWVHDDGTIDVRYDDGDWEFGVELDRISRPEKMPRLSTDIIKNAFENTLSFVEDSTSMANAKIHEFTDIGDGCLLLAMWSEGSAILLWDGRVHLDVNLFTYAENVELANRFSEVLSNLIPLMRLILRDEQPRGFGRVVNFQRDIQGFEPHWL